MANQLDLEEQEQLDQLKHFWKQYGNAITWVLIVVLGAYASWNTYQYWQRRQATQAAALFDEFERTLLAADATKDATKIDRVFADMKNRFGSTAYAQQAGLLVAKQYAATNKLDKAQAALTWVADHSSDTGYQAVARLRLSAVLAESKNFEGALAQLAGSFPDSFQALVADRRADILLLQGKQSEAVTEYKKAYRLLETNNEYRHLVDVKLNALGVDAQAPNAVTTATEKNQKL